METLIQYLVKFILEDYLILAVVLFGLGYIMKKSAKVKDTSIPWILCVIGIVFGVLTALATADFSAWQSGLNDIVTGIKQGILVAAVPVLVSQLIIQKRKANEEREKQLTLAVPLDPLAGVAMANSIPDVAVKTESYIESTVVSCEENDNKVEKRKKAMLSQPMNGKTEEEIKETREKAIKALEDKGYEVINTLFTDEWYDQKNMEARGVVQIPLCFLAKSLENMSLCHAVYFCKGWENARGCRIEHEAAKAYGLDIIYEEENTNA